MLTAENYYSHLPNKRGSQINGDERGGVFKFIGRRFGGSNKKRGSFFIPLCRKTQKKSEILIYWEWGSNKVGESDFVRVSKRGGMLVY